MKHLGAKRITYITKEGFIGKTLFQVGDKITRTLFAVSQICAEGRAVYFGPGPKFESYIIEDPEAFVAHNGRIIKIHMNNGVYEIDMKELYI